jgi:hypothetical protein
MDDTPARKVESRTGIAPPERLCGGALHHRSNRDEVLDATRDPSYKSVIAGIFGSDFSLKIARETHENSNRRECVPIHTAICAELQVPSTMRGATARGSFPHRSRGD